MGSKKKFFLKFINDNRVAICLFKMGYPILDIKQNNTRPKISTFVFTNTNDLTKDYEAIMDNREEYFEKYLQYKGELKYENVK